MIARLNGGGVYTQAYADYICRLAVGKFPNTVSGLMHWSLHAVETWCDELGLSVNPDKTGLVASLEEGNSQDSLNHAFWGYLATLHDDQVSRSDHGFTADLEGARGY
jgi:hypothetical protein